MYNTFYNLLKGLKAGTESESNGRHIIPPAAVQAAAGMQCPCILDIGAGWGIDLYAIRADLLDLGQAPTIFAVETFPAAIAALSNNGISVTPIDIEHNRLPFEDETCDIVICNQVLEHTKEIFWVVAEIVRVLKIDGTCILGVPNLGSWHNRFALLLGYQPPAIAVFGPHIRGFTNSGLRRFLELGGLLKVTKIVGGNFYPFRPAVSRFLCRFFPGLAVSSFFLIKRTGSGNFLSILDSNEASSLVDTPYFRGNPTK